MRRFTLPFIYCSLALCFAGAFACETTEDSAATSELEHADELERADAAADAAADDPWEPDGSDSDKRLRIEVALRRSPEVYSPRVEVAVERGVAHLRGSVKDEATRRAAIEVAARTPGIERVVDELEVFPFDAPRYRERVYAAFD